MTSGDPRPSAARLGVPRARAWTALATLVLAACSWGGGALPGGPTAPLAESGTRLRARYTDAGGGARRFDGWYDRELGSACTFMIAADGVNRCLVGDNFYNYPMFLDAGCTSPVQVFPTGMPVPAFVATGSNTGVLPLTCSDPLGPTAGAGGSSLATSWRVGAEAPATSTLYQLIGGGCMPTSSSGQLYNVEEIPPSSLVGATRVTIERRGATMAAAILEADDGSRAIRQIVDAARNQPCTPSSFDGVISDYRCYAATAIKQPTTSCSTQIVAGSADEIYLEWYSGCDVAPTFRKLVPTTCTDPLTLPSGCQAFGTSGDPFDATQFPELASGMVGTDRVRLVVSHPVDDDRGLAVNPASYAPVVGRYARGPFFDTERQLPCTDDIFGEVTIRPLADGTFRCLTADVIVAESFYADAACSAPIAQVLDDTGCTALATGIAPRFAVSREGGRVYALGSPVQQTNVYYLNDSITPPVCLAIPPVADTTYYDLTPADPGMFATLTKVKD